MDSDDVKFCSILLALIMLIASGLAYAMEWDFESRTLLAFSTTSLSVFITLVIVQWALKKERQQKWEIVRRITYGAIAAHLCDMVADLYHYASIPELGMHDKPLFRIMEGRDKPNPGTIAAFNELANVLRDPNISNWEEKDSSKKFSERDTATDRIILFYESNEVKWELDEIRDVLTPRVIQSSDNQDIINGLIEFDEARRDLHNSIIIHRQVVTYGVFPRLITLVEKSRDLYRLLSKKSLVSAFQ